MARECLAFDELGIIDLIATARWEGRECRRHLGGRRRNPYKAAAEAFDEGWNEQAESMSSKRVAAGLEQDDV